MNQPTRADSPRYRNQQTNHSNSYPPLKQSPDRPPAQMIRVVASRRKASRTEIQNAMQTVLLSAELCTRVEDAFHRCDRSANSQGKNVLNPVLRVFFVALQSSTSTM